MQQPMTFKTEVTREIRVEYLQHLPQITDGKTYPLVVFLHGAGERGNDLSKVKVHGIPKLLDEGSELLKGYDFIGISPQCPDDLWWGMLDDALEMLIEHLISALPVDTGRIYLTGLSMGGYGTWALAQRCPNMFAAIAPICGGTEPSPDKLAAIKHLPTWVFHGANDTAVPLAQSADAVSVLNNLGANVKFTVYPELEHDSWTPTYENPVFYEWLFAQRNEQCRP